MRLSRNSNWQYRSSGDLGEISPVNILLCVSFGAIAVWITYRGAFINDAHASALRDVFQQKFAGGFHGAERFHVHEQDAWAGKSGKLFQFFQLGFALIARCPNVNLASGLQVSAGIRDNFLGPWAIGTGWCNDHEVVNLTSGFQSAEVINDDLGLAGAHFHLQGKSLLPSKA